MKKQNMKLKTKEILKRIGTKKVYVAYGSNLDIGMMERRCPDAEVVGTGILHGWELEFRDYANIREDEKKSTPVLVWAVSASDEKALDRYEAFPELYRKEDVRFSVWDEDGNELQGEGMAYVMNFKGGPREPSPLYYAIIEKAYRDLGLPLHVLKDALKRSRKDR